MEKKVNRQTHKHTHKHNQVVAENSLTEKNVHMYYIRVKEGKNEKLKKESIMRISILISIYTVFLFDLILYVPSTIFQLNREGSSWVEPVLS